MEANFYRNIFTRHALSFGLAVAFLSGCVDTATQYKTYAARVEATGGLRTAVAPEDAPFDEDDLIRNFERIAFFTEFTHENGELKSKETASTLSRWGKSLKLRLDGTGVRPSDKISYGKLAERLSNLTGVEVTLSDAPGEDVAVYILTEEERAEFRDGLLKDENPDRFLILTEWAESFRFPCVATLNYDPKKPGQINRAIIVVKAELEGVLRESCIHEELTQVMGLMNDHSDVRPSIFNDDQEFALLTTHDELLLRILYDKRLRPDMTLDEAQPLIPEIVRDVRKTQD